MRHGGHELCRDLSGPSQGGEDKVAQHTVSKGRHYEIPVKSLIWGLTLPTCAMGWGVNSVHF